MLRKGSLSRLLGIPVNIRLAQTSYEKIEMNFENFE
jgi:hypothetical protein